MKINSDILFNELKFSFFTILGLIFIVWMATNLPEFLILSFLFVIISNLINFLSLWCFSTYYIKLKNANLIRHYYNK